MSNATLIIGQSGTGKSTSIRNLDPKSTFIINVLDKPLPIKAYKKNYTPIDGWSDKNGNYFSSDDHQRILRCIKMINEERKEISVLIIDDWQYILCNEFMKRASERGFDRFTDIAQHAWLTINAIINTREDLMCFVLSHSESDNQGRMKCKTIGKMLDEKITVEGLFTIVLHAKVMDGNYKFLTQNDGEYIAKSPMGMFEDKYIDNDLSIIADHIKNYYL